MSKSLQHKLQGVTLSTKYRKFLLSKSFVHQIPESNKKLVVGYILSVLNHDLPQIIIYWCLIFFNPMVDQWDSQHIHSSIFINRLKIKRISCWSYEPVFLTNIVSMGVHVWKFRFINCAWFDCIGIASINLSRSINYDALESRGLKKLTYYHMFGLKEIAANDVIDMRINFASCLLTFARNNHIISQVSIAPGKYKGAVNLFSNLEIELLQYQHFYVKT